jgi:hypothetical protein
MFGPPLWAWSNFSHHPYFGGLILAVYGVAYFFMWVVVPACMLLSGDLRSQNFWMGAIVLPIGLAAIALVLDWSVAGAVLVLWAWFHSW